MSFVLLSEQANQILKNFLILKGHKIIEIKKTDIVYDAVCSHTDIYVCKIGSEIILEPTQFEFIKDPLALNNAKYKVGQNKLSFEYPHNISFNAYCSDKYLIHNLKYTDPVILNTAKERKLIPINISQGYTKCNIVEIDTYSLITSDVGIAKTLENYDLDVLLISQGHVLLDGFDYGFLGGASGKVGNKIIFNGDLTLHPDFKKIIDFIQSKNLEVVYFKEYPLSDIGSIIEI